MPSFDDDGQNCHIGRIDTRYPTRLRQCFRFIGLQFFSTFKPHRDAFVIIQPRWDDNGLIFFRPFGSQEFMFDIPCISMTDFKLIQDRFRKLNLSLWIFMS